MRPMETEEDTIIPGLPDDMARECLIRIAFDQIHTVASVSKLWKREVDSPSFRLMRRSNGQSRSVLVLVQAEPNRSRSYRIVIVDPSSAADTWRSLPPVPGLPHGLPLFCRIAAVGTSLLVVGGWDPTTWAATDGVYVYDFTSAAWRCGARMPGPSRSLFGCAAGGTGTAVVVAGGHDGEKNALRSAAAYDVAKDAWVPLPDMAEERDECRGVFVGGRFYAVGGYRTETQGRFCGSAEPFDFDEWKWGLVVEDGEALLTCRPESAAETPDDVATVSEVVEMGGGDRFVIGSRGGAQACYLLEGGKGPTWRKMDAPAEYSGHIQAACCLQI